ncbi:hypothetical protein KFK09_006460 [Dendrobium nobile]|uniref:Uncharacterized protein n=1 Tax=Dendrobium nobile TaxID=94219 RepID=A0A8T3BTQ5_DENNO|nr:hypothetical protein KFK09_006460 [Dendrobium nobile]
MFVQLSIKYSPRTESSTHLFFECSYSHSIITSLIHDSSSILLTPSLLQLFEWIDDSPSSSNTKSFYFLCICSTIYHVWKEINERRFAHCSSSHATTLIKIKLFSQKYIDGKMQTSCWNCFRWTVLLLCPVFYFLGVDSYYGSYWEVFHAFLSVFPFLDGSACSGILGAMMLDCISHPRMAVSCNLNSS